MELAIFIAVFVVLFLLILPDKTPPASKDKK